MVSACYTHIKCDLLYFRLLKSINFANSEIYKIEMNIAALLSGGVDSSVALTRLVKAGHSVTAFYLKIWLEDELSFLGDCPWEQDLGYARAVCEQLGVKLEVISLQKEYRDRVVSYVIDQVKQGLTPSPDILCNQQVKFGCFFDHVDFEKFDKVATGHYADIREHNGYYELWQAPDNIKDQTYFLSYLSQAQLSKILFPIGDLEKSQVRELAHEYNLPTKDRKDSQGICFLGKISFPDFIKVYLGEKKGDIIELESDKKVGEHNGFWFYTSGQRKGLKLSGGPWYVVKKDPKKNIVYISREYFSDEKARDTVCVSKINWIVQHGVFPGQAREDTVLRGDGNPGDKSMLSDLVSENKLFVKLRHGPEFHKVTNISHDNTRVNLTLAERDQGIAPGQFAVFYEKSYDGSYRCLGSGIICE